MYLKNIDILFSFVSKLSDSIRVRSHAENTREDVAKFREYSPEFFWLIRDVTLAITDDNNKPCDINTYLKQKVCCRLQCYLNKPCNFMMKLKRA